MIHNKYFDVLGMFTGNYQREVYWRELIGKVSIRQKNIALTLDALESLSILKSTMKGTTRSYSLNISHTEIKDVIVIPEIMKTIRFMENNRKVAHVFRQDPRVVGVFGSYAKGAQKESSDIDVFVIGKKSKDEYGEKGKPLGLKISVKCFTLSQWTKLIASGNSLCREIIENHVLLFGAERFVHSVWEDYYGLS